MTKLKIKELKLLRDHAWDYFSLHANQRTTLFRYFIVFATLYITGIALLLSGFYCSGKSSEVFVIASSLAFIVVTIIFWILDYRNKRLIGYASNSLLEIENILNNDKTLSNDIFVFKKDKKNEHIGHTKCYWAIFVIAICFAFSFSLYASYSLADGKADCALKHIKIESFPTEKENPSDPDRKLKLDITHQPSSSCDK